MKKYYRFYTVPFIMMILIITTSSGAFFTGDGQPNIKTNDPFVKASTNLSDRKAVPEGLTKTEWGKISAPIERYRYRLNQDERTGKYQAINHTHNLDATFTREGFEVSPRKGEKGWNWGLSLSRYGYGSYLHAVPVVKKMITRDNRIEYHRGDMVEWYINDHRGLEQGFTLKARPSGRKGSDPLQLEMTTTTNLIPVVEKEGKGIIFRDAQRKEALRYSGLYAYDAAGKELDSRMTADQKGIRLIVADGEAVYPITIDPFIETKKLLAGDGAAGDVFGNSVSINGDTAIIGARGDDDNGDDSGSAYIFSRDQGGVDNWGEIKKLTAGDGGADDQFGWSVSISEDTAIVGAYGDDDNGSNSGSAYIFSRDEGGTNNWGQVKKLLPSDGAAEDHFGERVSISQDTAIVGASWDDNNTGSAYIFSRDHGGADNWGQVKKLLAGDGTAGDYFGVSVSISRDTAIVGAIGKDDGFGSAYIFSRDQGGTDNWGQVKKLTASDGAVMLFGLGVSINGDTAIIGASYDNYMSGSAYIFSRDHGGADNWGQVNKLLASDGAEGDLFGTSVSISGDTAIVGAQGDDYWSGSAYIFSRDQGGADNWGQVNKLTVAHLADGDHFGSSVSISGDTAIVGAYWDDDKGTNSGSAYIFSYVFRDELALDFGPAGLWDYDGTNWAFILGSSPEDMVGWSGGLAMDFGASGLWNYDGTTWTPISGSNIEDMTDWVNGLAINVGALGLWNYDGTTWTPISGSSPEGMAGWSGGLAMDFGASGLWNYDGSTWTSISGSSPESMAGWSGGLSINFGALDVWNYDGTTWTFISGSNVEDMADWVNGLAINFGTLGVWNYDGTAWAFISGFSPEGMAGWSDGLAMDFDNLGLGLHNYDGTNWNYISSGVEDMDDVDLF